MKREPFWRIAIRCLSGAVVLALLLVPVGMSPAAAQEISDYFEFSYEPVQFVDGDGHPKTDIDGYETFYAQLRGSATCTQDLPSPYDQVTALRFRFKVIAELDEGGGQVTLNSRYTITIEPFPTKAGDSVEINRDIPLKFPGGSQSGTYHISGELIEAEVKVSGFLLWKDITDEIPEEYGILLMDGPVTYTVPPNSPPNPPGNPFPANGATGVSLPVTLGVRVVDIDNDAMTVTFFDASDDSVIGTVAGVASGSRAEVGWPGLDAGTTYSWYARAHDGKAPAPAQSDTWSFTTEAPVNNPPNAPSNPAPADGATGVATDIELSWTGGDPDPGDTVTYDVHFGTGPNPPLVSENQPGTRYDPGTLEHNTKYYWKIVARDDHGLAREGPVWNFTTAPEDNGAPPPPPPATDWNCPLGAQALIAPNPPAGRPTLTAPVACADITVSAGAELWGIYYLVEEPGPQFGEWLWYVPGFQTSTLTELEPGKYYWVVVSQPCILTIPQQ